MSQTNSNVEQPFVPLVSCVMPTCNRSRYVPMAIKLFLEQNYDGAELLIVDDGNDPVEALIPDHPRIRYVYLKEDMTLGAKRNVCCDLARGQIIMHWDDDDWYANWRLSYQTAHLLHSGKQICGVSRMYYADPKSRNAWLYAYPEKFGTWVAGGSFCFLKSLWESHPFEEINDGEDSRFIFKMNPDEIHILERFDFYVGRVHTNNTSVKRTDELVWLNQPISDIEAIIGEDFQAWAQ